MSLHDGFAAAHVALASARAEDAAEPAAEPGLVPRDQPRRRAADDRPRRPGSGIVVQAPGGRHRAVRLEGARVESARPPLPPPRRAAPAGALARDAAAERRPRDAVQPPLCPLRPPLPGPLRIAGARG